MDEKAQKKIIRRMGREKVAHLLWLQNAEENSTHQKAYDAIRALAERWEPPVFPVLGRDMLAAGFKEGREYGDALHAMEAEWEDSGYMLDAKELLRRAKKRGTS